MHQRLREGYDPSKEPFPVYPYTVQMFPSHTAVLQNNYELAEKTGNLKTYFKTQVKKLIRDEKSGRVTGVYACSHDGKLIRATARKGVVLATGDYSGNPEMLEYYCARFANNFIIPCGVDPDGKPCNTGDGHRMGMWIGAKMEVSPHCANVHNMGSAMGVTPYLMLDLSGQRFMNEECSGQSVENQITLLKNKTAWQFFDGGWREQVPFMPVGHGACTKVLEEKDFADGKCFDKLTPMDGFASQRYIDKTIEKGDTFKADTLEELIERIGLPKEQALSSIQRYNELAKKGNDEDFGKSAARMFALEKPPFYATRITPAALLCCHSGLESDEYAHCYDEDLNLIKGLYVAGNVQGNRFAVDYPTLLPGISHSIALVFGRAAGYNAANEI